MFVSLREQKKKREDILHVWTEIGTRDFFRRVEERLGFFARREPFSDFLLAVCLVVRVERVLVVLWACRLVNTTESASFVESLRVVLVRAPLQVGGAVVVADTVFVVDHRQVLRIWYKRACDEAVDERHTLALWTEIESLVSVVRPTVQESARLDTEDAPVAVEQQSGVIGQQGALELGFVKVVHCRDGDSFGHRGLFV